MTPSQVTERRVALGMLAVALVASFAVLLWLGHGQTIRGDNLEYATRLASQSFGHALLHTPPNKYLIAVPLLLYRVMFEIFGLGDYFPYRLVAVAFVVLCGGLFYALVRRRVGYLLALPPTILLLFFGSGWEEVLTAIRLPSLIAIACGLGALLAIERRTPAWDVVAAALLCIAVASHPTGVAFTVAAAVVIILSPVPRRWTRLWVIVAPAAVFGAWYLFWRAPSTPTPFPTHASDLFLFLRQSWVMVCATVTGLSGVLPAPVYRQAPAEILGAVMFAALALVVALRFRRLTPLFWAALAALVALVVSTRLSPGGFLRRSDEVRYMFPAAVLFLLMVAALAEPFRLPRWAKGAATLVLLLGVCANAFKLSDGADTARLKSQVTKGQLSGYTLAGENLNRGYRPGPLETTAGLDLAAMAKFGSPALSSNDLPAAPLVTRQWTDRALAGSLGVVPEPGASSGRAGLAPQVVRAIDGRATSRDGCLELTPQGGQAEGAPPLAELSLPPAGVTITASDLARVRLLLGMFAPPSVPLKEISGRSATLSTPADRSTVPWKLTVLADERVTVCGLAGG